MVESLQQRAADPMTIEHPKQHAERSYGDCYAFNTAPDEDQQQQAASGCKSQEYAAQRAHLRL